jgi:hypothetical protein
MKVLTLRHSNQGGRSQKYVDTALLIVLNNLSWRGVAKYPKIIKMSRFWMLYLEKMAGQAVVGPEFRKADSPIFQQRLPTTVVC